MRVFISNITSYVGKNILQLYAAKKEEEGEDSELDIVGTVCTSLDRSANKAELSLLSDWARVRAHLRPCIVHMQYHVLY